MKKCVKCDCMVDDESHDLCRWCGDDYYGDGSDHPCEQKGGTA